MGGRRRYRSVVKKRKRGRQQRSKKKSSIKYDINNLTSTEKYVRSSFETKSNHSLLHATNIITTSLPGTLNANSYYVRSRGNGCVGTYMYISRATVNGTTCNLICSSPRAALCADRRVYKQSVCSTNNTHNHHCSLPNTTL